MREEILVARPSSTPVRPRRVKRLAYPGHIRAISLSSVGRGDSSTSRMVKKKRLCESRVSSATSLARRASR